VQPTEAQTANSTTEAHDEIKAPEGGARKVIVSNLVSALALLLPLAPVCTTSRYSGALMSATEVEPAPKPM
jgi:hypothetical protein